MSEEKNNFSDQADQNIWTLLIDFDRVTATIALAQALQTLQTLFVYVNRPHNIKPIKIKPKILHLNLKKRFKMINLKLSEIVLVVM